MGLWACVVLANPLSRWLPLHAPIPMPHSERASLGKAGTGAQEPGLAQLLTGCFLQCCEGHSVTHALWPWNLSLEHTHSVYLD